VAQFDTSGDINKVKVRYDTLAEIWNKFDGCQSLLEENEEHDHEADRTLFEETYYNLKSDMERLSATLEKGSRSVVPKVQTLSFLQNTTGSDIT
jgi:hypothetical protein